MRAVCHSTGSFFFGAGLPAPGVCACSLLVIMSLWTRCVYKVARVIKTIRDISSISYYSHFILIVFSSEKPASFDMIISTLTVNFPPSPDIVKTSEAIFELLSSHTPSHLPAAIRHIRHKSIHQRHFQTPIHPIIKPAPTITIHMRTCTGHLLYVSPETSLQSIGRQTCSGSSNNNSIIGRIDIYAPRQVTAYVFAMGS